MLEKIFDINNFNIIMDDNNYYFFRAINTWDDNDIKKGVITNDEGQIFKLRTDRERCSAAPKYTENDNISLQEVYDHIKIHYRRDTNCISLTTNANVALMYGDGWYNNQYVMVKVPKKEMGIKCFNAGLYMLKEIKEEIQKQIDNGVLEPNIVSLIKKIDEAQSEEELVSLFQNKENKDDIFQNGIVFFDNNYKFIDYNALNFNQNLEKNKLILKLKIINKNILPYVNNDFLIKTIGNAFSSLEVIHYKGIDTGITNVSREIVDIFSLLQQVPKYYPNLDDLKEEVLNFVKTGTSFVPFDLDEIKLDNSKDYTIENMYNLTNGSISFSDAYSMYKKSFYLAKSKLRARNTIKMLRYITNNNPKYNDIINLLDNNSFGIESEIMSRLSIKENHISESVSFNFNEKEKALFNFINHLCNEDCEYIIHRPLDAISYYLNQFNQENYFKQEKKEYYANAIIDLFDFKKLGIMKLYPIHRFKLVQKLMEHDVIGTYEVLKNKGIPEEKIAESLLTTIVKGREVSSKETFSLEELEWFLGYNQVKDTKLKLYTYQRQIAEAIDKTLKTRNYTNVIVPTGGGKSYISLYELYQHKDEELLYLAPNVEILNQLKKIIREVFQPEEHLTESEEQIIKKIFPKLTLGTYQDLQNVNEEQAVFNEYGFKDTILKEKYKKKYKYIVCDELHRTGACGWNEYVKMIFDMQDKNTKVLGITATPERDVDNKDMANYWAEYFGYTKKEILQGKHKAADMDIIEAIKMGIIANPKVINCAYSLIKDGSMDELRLSIEDIQDEELKISKRKKYEKLRREVENSNGIEKILHDNLKPDSKCIVFIPITKKNDGRYENEFGEQIDRSTGERMIKDYISLVKQYIYSYNYLNEPNNQVQKLYNKLTNNINLSSEEIDYLNQEKENILLLAKINIKYKPTALNTDTNIIAEKIIDYMNWQPLKKSVQANLLSKKTSDIVEDYSMLGSYTAKKNSDNLANFNKPTNGKAKLMFVMNKLNEGVHVKDVKKIVWLRVLNEESRILYYQQLGRCIHSVNVGTKIAEEDRPVVIDLVNNTLKVKLDKKSKKTEDINLEEQKEDLRILKNIVNNFGKSTINTDNINSSNSIYIGTLKRMYNKYHKYTNYTNELVSLNENKKIIINEIIETGSMIDLWNTQFFKENKDLKSTFNYFYSLLVKLKESGQPTNLATDDKIEINEDGSLTIVKKGQDCYDDKNLIAIGNWLYMHQLELSDEEKQMLKDIGYELQEDNQIILTDNPEDLTDDSEDYLSLLYKFSISSVMHDFYILENKVDNYVSNKFNYYYDLLVKLKESDQSTKLVSTDKIRINEDRSLTVVKIGQEGYNDKNLIAIGDWLYKHQKKLSAEEKQMLRDIGYELKEDKSLANRFNYYYDLLIKLKESDQPTNLTSRDKIRINEDGSLTIVKKGQEGYNDENLISIGDWLNRNQKKLSAEEKQMLREIGYELKEDKKVEYTFNYFYSLLEKLKESGQSTKLVKNDRIRINEDDSLTIVKKGQEGYDDENLISIGDWLNRNQKKLSAEEKQRLRDIGYELKEDKSLANKFNYYYDLLVKLKESDQPTNLTSRAKIRINENGSLTVVKIGQEGYNDKNLIAIGDWLYKHQKEFSAEEKQMLRDIGYELQEDKKVEYTFNYFYSLLEKLKESGQTTNLVSGDRIRINENGSLTVVKIGQEGYNDKNLIAIGDWLYKHQKEFSAEEKQMLRDIGYELQEDKKKKYKSKVQKFNEVSNFEKLNNNITKIVTISKDLNNTIERSGYGHGK